MRWTLARNASKTPAGLVYFKGEMTVAETEDGLQLVPSVGFFQGDAFIFPTLAIANQCCEMLNAHRADRAGFMALPYLAAEAAPALPVAEAREVAP